ncbi:MAG: radical SAM protein, partial [Desulfobacula sp.]|nr:radical SAM protein [Desulfobacula sp.]
IWLEILILPDINDSIEELQLLKNAIIKINPDKVQLNTLDRPGTVNNLRPANKAELQQIMNFWDFNNTEIIASVPERKDMKSYREDTENAILETISRRPCTLNDLGKILGIHINEINKYLGVLDDDGKIETNRQERGVFYQTRHK